MTIAPLDFAYRIRHEHTFDRTLSVPMMHERVTEWQNCASPHGGLFHALLDNAGTHLRGPLAAPMTHVVRLLESDPRFLDMRMLSNQFVATVLGASVNEECHCIAGWAYELAVVSGLSERDGIKFFGWNWQRVADIVLAAAGHTAAAAGHIDYFASQVEGRRQVLALAELESRAVLAKPEAAQSAECGQ